MHENLCSIWEKLYIDLLHLIPTQNRDLWLVQKVNAAWYILFELRYYLCGPKNPLKVILHGNLCSLWEKLGFGFFWSDLTSKLGRPTGPDGQCNLVHLIWAEKWTQRTQNPPESHISWVADIHNYKYLNKPWISKRQYFFRPSPLFAPLFAPHGWKNDLRHIPRANLL